jgi:hypothetical protein
MWKERVRTLVGLIVLGVVAGPMAVVWCIGAVVSIVYLVLKK